jgi:pentatricopeptide repeat protein
MRKYVLILTAFLIFGVFVAFGLQNGYDSYKFDQRAIVVLGYLDWRQGGSGAIRVPRVAFAIGDGTLLLTAAHCVDDFQAEPDEPISIDKIIISPYYGDVYDFKIAAVDKKADVAILKAPWPAHPALALASEEEFAAAANILIASRPQENVDKSMHVGRTIKTELLEILTKDDKNPNYDIRLKGTKNVVPGWSGSPMLIPDSGKATGITTREIKGIKGKMFGLITISSRNDAAGCSLHSIKALVEKYNLEKSAFASPANFEDIPDAASGFNLALDFLDTLFAKKVNNSFNIASELTKIRPDSVQAQLLLALSSMIKAMDPNLSKNEYLELADARYKKALQLDPNNSLAHAVYSNFLIKNGKNKEALEQCNASLAADPNNRMALFNKLMIIDPNERKEVAEHYLSIEPNNPRILFYYSGALSRIGENEKALEAAQKAVENDPNGLYYGALADILAKLRRYDDAEHYYRLMTEKCGCQSCWFKYANFLYGYRKKIKEAMLALEKSESLSYMNRISTEDRNYLKLMIYEKTEPQKAEIMAKELLEASPDKAVYWYFYAGILRTQKKYNEAAEAAQKAVDLSKDFSFHPRLANCLAKIGKLEKAEQIYDELHKEHPERYSYWFWYSEFLVDYFDNRIDEAKEALEKVPYDPDKDRIVTPDDIKKLEEKIAEKSKKLLVTDKT